MRIAWVADRLAPDYSVQDDEGWIEFSPIALRLILCAFDNSVAFDPLLRLILLTRAINTRNFDASPVAISRHPSTSVQDHVEHASNSSPLRHSEKHLQPPGRLDTVAADLREPETA